ncbi:MAG: 50S ribosomal protein L9, partial [Planctomycetota bacterium]
MARTVEILLTETVDNLGLVGDVVRVRPGYARNFLLPSGRAIPPSEEAVRELAQRRAEAERELLRQKEMRSAMVEKLEGHEITLERSCNDQGQLYGSVTQRDIADALEADGFSVRPRDVRLPHAIKRIDTYDVLIKFDADLSASIKVWVIADRPLETDEDREEMEFDDEGNLIEKPARPAPAPAEPPAAEAQP